MLSTIVPSLQKNGDIIEGFERKFFYYRPKVYFAGVTRTDDNNFTMAKTLNKYADFNLNTMVIPGTIKKFTMLNENKLQLIMSESNTLYHLMFKIGEELRNVNTDNVRFVASLHKAPVNVLTHILDMYEFRNLKGSGLTVNIGTKYSTNYFTAKNLFLHYQLIVGKDIFVTNYSPSEVLSHYGNDVDVVIYTASHPDPLVYSLTEKKLTRFVNLNKINNGNIYHFSLDEQPFYQDNNYYIKDVIDKNRIFQMYPNTALFDMFYNEYINTLSDARYNSFVNTISVKYNLLSNNKTDNKLITKFLYKLAKNIGKINQLEFIVDKINPIDLGDFTLPIHVHEGARDYYERIGTFTNLPNKPCVMIDGRCSEALLYKHQLLFDKHEKTRDEGADHENQDVYFL